MNNDTLIPWYAAGVVVAGLVVWSFCPVATVGTAPDVRLASNLRDKSEEPSAPVPVQQRKERYYRDRRGDAVSEREAEDALRQLRSNIKAMPDTGKRAYMEGVLRAYEEEWVRMKRQGPIEPPQTHSSERVSGDGSLPESKRRRIFYELVVAQDSGMGDVHAYIFIGKRHNLPHATLLEIAHEGAAKDWPMPPR